MKLWCALVFACATLACGAEKSRDARIVEALAAAEKSAEAERWPEALAAGNRLRSLCHDLLGEEHADTALAELFLGEVRDHLGDRTLAEAHFRRALAMQEKVLPRDAPELVTTLTRLGACLKDAQRYDEAAGLLQRALDLQVKVHGEDDATTAVALQNLARLLRLKGDHARPAPLLERAVSIQRRALGGTDPVTLSGLEELARAQELAGDFAAAEQATAERVAGVEARFGAPSEELAAALADWARLAEQGGRLADAEPRARRALAIAESLHVADDPALAAPLTQLGRCLRSLGRLDDAQPLLERALALRLKQFGPEHPETAASQRELGWLFRVKRDFAAALPLFEQVFAIRERALGPHSALTIESLGELADLHWLRGANDDAAAEMERRRYLAEEAFGPESAETVAAWHDLAVVYESAKRWPEATAAALRSLRLHEGRLGPAAAETLGEMVLLSRICAAAGEFGPALTQYARLAAWFAQHPEAGGESRAELLRQFAIASLRAGRAEEAGPLFRDSRRAHELALGPDHPATLRSIGDLWTYYDATRQPALAREIAEELARRTAAAFGADAPQTIAVCDRLGQLRLTLGDRAGALEEFRRALDGRRRHFGEGSAEVLDALGQVAAWFEEARDFATAVTLRRERLEAIGVKQGRESEAAEAALGELAMACFRQRDLGAARTIFERQLAIAARRTGEDGVEALAVVARLGDVALAQGDSVAAVKLRERLVAGCARRYGATHPENARALLLLGEVRLAAGINQRAEKALRDAHDILKTADAAQAGLVARAACGIARAQLRRGNLGEAKRWMLGALSGSFPHDEPLAEAFSLLGDELARAGDEASSESSLTAALMILTDIAGDHDEHTFALLQRLGVLRLRVNRRGAAALLERALAASETLNGADSPETATVLGWLALARVEEHRFPEARAAAARRLAIVNKTGGDADPQRISAREMDAWTAFCAADSSQREAAFAAVSSLLVERWPWCQPLCAPMVGALAEALELTAP